MTYVKLAAGPLKRVYLDREAAARDAPAWVIRTIEDTIHSRAITIEGMTRARGDRDAPLTPTGPAFWLETFGEIWYE